MCTQCRVDRRGRKLARYICPNTATAVTPMERRLSGFCGIYNLGRSAHPPPLPPLVVSVGTSVDAAGASL